MTKNNDLYWFPPSPDYTEKIKPDCFQTPESDKKGLSLSRVKKKKTLPKIVTFFLYTKR